MKNQRQFNNRVERSRKRMKLIEVKVACNETLTANDGLYLLQFIKSYEGIVTTLQDMLEYSDKCHKKEIESMREAYNR